MGWEETSSEVHDTVLYFSISLKTGKLHMKKKCKFKILGHMSWPTGIQGARMPHVTHWKGFKFAIVHWQFNISNEYLYSQVQHHSKYWASVVRLFTNADGSLTKDTRSRVVSHTSCGNNNKPLHIHKDIGEKTKSERIPISSPGHMSWIKNVMFSLKLINNIYPSGICVTI